MIDAVQTYMKIRAQRKQLLHVRQIRANNSPLTRDRELIVQPYLRIRALTEAIVACTTNLRQQFSVDT